MDITFDHKEALRVLASISSIKERDTIRMRNTILKDKLLLLKPYIGISISEVPDDILKEVLDNTYQGCPHCDYCKKCKWFTAVSKTNKEGYTLEELVDLQRKYIIKACCYLVGFGPNNITLNMVKSLKSISVCYGSNDEQIRIDELSYVEDINFDMILSAEDFSKCMEFVQGHLDWTDLDCWGSACPD